jgi:hypothetical protein
MLKKIIVILFVCFSSFLFAQQQNGQYIHKHLVRADASIAAGYMFKDNISNVHINGNLEYYMDNKISIRGDANWMAGSNGLTADSMGLKDYYSVMLGIVYHFHTNGHLDPYFILQPGFAYTSSFHQAPAVGIYTQDNSPKTYYQGVISPLTTAGFGINYYFQRFAHLFIEARYVYGNHLSEAPTPMSLQELRITFGLGFNLFIIKEKKNPL